MVNAKICSLLKPATVPYHSGMFRGLQQSFHDASSSFASKASNMFESVKTEIAASILARGLGFSSEVSKKEMTSAAGVSSLVAAQAGAPLSTLVSSSPRTKMTTSETKTAVEEKRVHSAVATASTTSVEIEALESKPVELPVERPKSAFKHTSEERARLAVEFVKKACAQIRNEAQEKSAGSGEFKRSHSTTGKFSMYNWENRTRSLSERPPSDSSLAASEGGRKTSRSGMFASDSHGKFA